MKDQIDLIREEIRALEYELFPEYFGDKTEEDQEELEEDQDVA